jgi:acetylornithine deacetylase/succinyl-diaminopimelate desuccinylase-like protein
LTLTQRQVDQVRATATALAGHAIELASRICEVPAPTGMEHQRARLVASMFADTGYTPEVDEIGNVYVQRGSRGGDVLLLAAHTDTVFPNGTAISVNRGGNLIRGPGIGDNSLGVAAMITALRALDDLRVETDADIVAVADVGEEGLGNLRGIRAAIDRYRNQIGAVIAIEGHNLGRVTHVAVGSLRWRIVVRGPGGHSWGAFGKPSAVHGLGRIIAGIADIEVPAEPKTTYNVGAIEGGVSVNSIAPMASALVDMRSVDRAALDALAAQVRSVVERTPGDGLTTEVEVIGERPAGSVPHDAPLVLAAGDVLRALGIEPVFDASSTDANAPIGLGIPAVCIGITHGSLGHTAQEMVEIAPIATGLAQLLGLSLEATSIVGGGRT